VPQAQDALPSSERLATPRPEHHRRPNQTAGGSSGRQSAQVPAGRSPVSIYLSSSRNGPQGIGPLLRLAVAERIVSAWSGHLVAARPDRQRTVGPPCELNLQHTPLNVEGLLQISKLKNVFDINLEDATISDAGLAHIGSLTKHAHLNLNGTQVGNEGLQILKAQTNLTILHVGNTRVTEEVLRARWP